MIDSVSVPGFRPTHVVPGDGIATWEAPDINRPSAPLDPFLPVELVDRRGDWGQILCANGWSAWVDGRLLIAVPQAPPAAGQPLARTADPRPLLARAEKALAEYRSAVESLAAGQVDGETFRTRTRGVHVGLVVDGEAVWLYEAEHERWVYCDGKRLATFATESPPHDAPMDSKPSGGAPAEKPADPTPTQIVTPSGPAPPAPGTGGGEGGAGRG
ncbi:hypothetical protein ACWGI8_33705 [Streptomyces sp. NPDC054841]